MESPKLSLRNPPRFICTALFGVSAALWASPGWTQTPTSTSTSTTAALTTSDFTIILQRLDGSTWVDLSNIDASVYLNQARCQCATKIRFLVQMAYASRSKLASLTTTGTNAKLYVGNNCAGLNSLNVPYCADSAILGTPLLGLSTLSSNGSWAVETTVDKIFAGVGVACTDTLTTSIVLWINTTGTISPDLTGSSAPSLAIKLDGTPPPAPTGVVVESGGDALEVSWLTEATDNPDLVGYLVFCMQGDGLQVFNPSSYNSDSNKYDCAGSSQYCTSQILCQASVPAPSTDLPSSAAGVTTASEVQAPAIFQNLNPAYLCSGLLPPSKISVRLGALQGGIPYTVGVAAVDNSGNASPIQSGFVQVPSVVQVPDATAGITGGLGRAGCACHIAGVDRGAVAWAATLALAAAGRLRRRGKRQR
jgi:MYXO-CTERM domain-containing protein